MNMVIFFLTCADDEEAEKISQALLEKHLIVCAKRTTVSSAFFWQGNIDKAGRILLVRETSEENYDEIEKEVGKLHSYETFVLTAVPVARYSKGVAEWLNEGLKI